MGLGTRLGFSWKILTLTHRISCVHSGSHAQLCNCCSTDQGLLAILCFICSFRATLHHQSSFVNKILATTQTLSLEWVNLFSMTPRTMKRVSMWDWSFILSHPSNWPKTSGDWRAGPCKLYLDALVASLRLKVVPWNCLSQLVHTVCWCIPRLIVPLADRDGWISPFRICCWPSHCCHHVEYCLH